MSFTKKKKMISRLSLFLIIIYGVVIIYFTLFSDRLGRVDLGTHRYNLIPFYEIQRFIKYRNVVSMDAFILNICGNLLVFAPLGFLIPVWHPKKVHWYSILIDSFLFSLCIEILQFYLRVGVFDVDDLIMNTSGGMIGWFFYYFVYHFIYCNYQSRKRRKKIS